MRLWRSLAFSTIALMAAAPAFAQGPADVPRNETLIVENPEGTIKNAGWFNIWAINAGGQSTGLHQLAMDTLLVHRPRPRPRRRLGQLARRRAADLQRRLHRDDGEAAPGHLLERRRRVHRRRRGLHHRDPAQDQRPALRARSSSSTSTSVEAPDTYTVVFKLKKPNSRFHALFTVRWNAALDHAEARLREARTRSSSTSTRRSRSAPTRCTATTRTASGSSGRSATTGSARRSAASASRGRSTSTYVDPGPPDKRVIAQLNHELDIIHDISPEGMFTLVKQSPDVARLVQGLPLRPSRSDAAAGHLQPPEREVPEPRRALGAGAADRHQGGRRWRPIAVRRRSRRSRCRRPARIRTTTTSRCRSGSRTSSSTPASSKIKPYDPTVGKQIADMLRPSMGDQIPTDPEEIAARLRPRLVEAGPAGGGASCWSGPASPSAATTGTCRTASRFTITRHGRGRGAAGDDPRRHR